MKLQTLSPSLLLSLLVLCVVTDVESGQYRRRKSVVIDVPGIGAASIDEPATPEELEDAPPYPENEPGDVPPPPAPEEEEAPPYPASPRASGGRVIPEYREGGQIPPPPAEEEERVYIAPPPPIPQAPLPPVRPSMPSTPPPALPKARPAMPSTPPPALPASRPPALPSNPPPALPSASNAEGLRTQLNVLIEHYQPLFQDVVRERDQHNINQVFATLDKIAQSGDHIVFLKERIRHITNWIRDLILPEKDFKPGLDREWNALMKELDALGKE